MIAEWMGQPAVISVRDSSYLPDPMATYSPWDSDVLIEGTDGS